MSQNNWSFRSKFHPYGLFVCKFTMIKSHVCFTAILYLTKHSDFLIPNKHRQFFISRVVKKQRDRFEPAILVSDETTNHLA